MVKQLFDFGPQGRVVSARTTEQRSPGVGSALQGFLEYCLNLAPPLFIHFLCPGLLFGAAKDQEAPFVMEDDVPMILTWQRSEMRAERILGTAWHIPPAVAVKQL
jgi:hypothetical protein